MRLRALLLAPALLVAAPAAAHHVDPWEVIGRAFQAFDARGDYAETRAIFSAALRQAPHNGKLDPAFALVFAVYADLVRNNDDPAFALQLVDQGLALVAGAAEPDEEARNALLVSRAYALAELGRYREAIDTATIVALWLGDRFGAETREGLEAAIRDWVRKDGGGDDGPPPVYTSALSLLLEAQEALLDHDTAGAILLASRAALPQGAGLDENAVAVINGWGRSIIGVAYAAENKYREAVAVLRAAVDSVAEEAWDGTARPRIRPLIATEAGGRRILWDIFINLGQSATFAGDLPLATLALEVAQDYVRSPIDRYSLLVQRAALLVRSSDFAAVEKVFLESEAEARAAGDAENAALARFYVAIIRLRIAFAAGSTEEAAQAMLAAAEEAAAAAAGNRRQVEYILTLAVQHAAAYGMPAETVLPVARRAFAVFRDGQREMAGYDSGQEAARRERRRFLESYLDTLYEAGGQQP